MDIQITGRHVDVGDALRAHVLDRLEAGISKYFDLSLAGHVTVSKQGFQFLVDCTVKAPRGVTLQSHGEAGEAYAAFDAAVEKMEKQLRRYKRRLTNHHAQVDSGGRQAEAAQAYILAADAEDHDHEHDHNQEQPLIVAETRTEIPRVSVSNAVMLMNLANAPAFLFRNAQSDQLNVVYRRADGNIGWIDPTPQGATAA